MCGRGRDRFRLRLLWSSSSTTPTATSLVLSSTTPTATSLVLDKPTLFGQNGSVSLLGASSSARALVLEPLRVAKLFVLSFLAIRNETDVADITNFAKLFASTQPGSYSSAKEFYTKKGHYTINNIKIVNINMLG